jgi:hypothetical protein
MLAAFLLLFVPPVPDGRELISVRDIRRFPTLAVVEKVVNLQRDRLLQIEATRGKKISGVNDEELTKEWMDLDRRFAAWVHLSGALRAELKGLCRDDLRDLRETIGRKAYLLGKMPLPFGVLTFGHYLWAN